MQPDTVTFRIRRWPIWITGLSMLGLLLVLHAAHTPAHRTLQLTLLDAYQKIWPRERKSAPAVIVAIDEASLARYGQWPWPRNELARLVNAIGALKPAAIGIDLLFPEPDRHGSSATTAEVSGNDLLFAVSLRNNRAVLAIAGTVAESESGGGIFPPVRVEGSDPLLLLPLLPQFRSVIRSTPVLDRAAAGHGIISADAPDGIIRNIPLAVAVQNAIAPALALEMIRVAADEPVVRLRANADGLLSVGTGDVAVPVDKDGRAWIRYGRHDPDRFVSAVDVLEGRVDPARISSKLVLVGLTGLALVDYPATPVNPSVPGAEIHAQLIENIFDGDHLTRPRWAGTAELLALALCGTLFVLLTPLARPWLALTGAAALIAALVAIGVGAFRISGVLLDVASPAVALLLVFMTTMAGKLIETESQRRRLRETLQVEREAAARVAGELEAARRVQTGLLPDAATLTAIESRCEVAAWMAPAREVGGDLYDFFKPSADRLTFLVGDVSGKGLPASLFMAISKALCKSAALRSVGAVDRILTEANAEIARDNPEAMFVTAVLCSLELQTGELRYANAGHDAPILIGKSGLTRLTQAGGPPLCMFDHHDYPGATHTMVAGEMVLLYTDGVTEAMDAERRLYGRDRLFAVLKKLPAASSCADVIAAVRGDLQAFGAVEMLADDITLLALRWHGPAVVKTT
jgi:adenylate cyclase